MTRLLLVLLALAAPLGCGASHQGGPSDAAPDKGGEGPPAAGVAPLDVPAGQWTWVDVPGSACDDGTPTGFAVSPGPPGAAGDLFVYFAGGGACWDYSTCFVLNAATHGPFGKAQWTAAAAGINVGPFDRARATNPFRASTYVFVPYCTGDLHAGSNVASYQGPAETRLVHHVGRQNAEAVLARLVATWPHAPRVVVSGTSAGGYGATFNYDLYRRAYGAAKMALVADAGPLLKGNGIYADLRAAWFDSWHLGDVVLPLCAGCRDDLSGVYTALSTRHPNDRLALLSALTDPVISLYFMLALDQFQTDLLQTIHDRFDPTTNVRAYLLTGTQHGLLPTQASTTSAGVPLETWLAGMVNDGAFATVNP